MPIEIMELVMKAKISDEQSPASGRDRERPTQTSSRADPPTEAEKAVQEALEILKRKNER